MQKKKEAEFSLRLFDPVWGEQFLPKDAESHLTQMRIQSEQWNWEFFGNNLKMF